MEKYRNKYRIPSARAQWWDYGWNGAYFITICTQDRRHIFGDVYNGNMVLSPVGAIADVLWHEIPHHIPFVELGDFVVMPNHVHGILILNRIVETLHATSQPQTLHATSVRDETKNAHMSRISPKPASVPSIIRSYKAAVTRHSNRLGLDMAWQTRYHDHIIRNDQEYQRISDYILANPARWQQDKFFNCTDVACNVSTGTNGPPPCQ